MSEVPFLNVNGQLMDAAHPSIFPSNRSFRYGDGFFESIRIINGNPVFLEDHLSRLFEGMTALGIEVPPTYSADFFREQIGKLLEANSIRSGGRVRLAVSRQSGGWYLPGSDQPDLIIEALPLDNNLYVLNDVGLSVDIYPEMKKQVNRLSAYKTSNGLMYVMSAKWAREKELSESLIVNDKDVIIESSSSNLFIVCNGVLYTPSLADGCIGGVLRMNLINMALENKLKVYECSLTPQNLLVADEVFLTNAIKGIQWVSAYRNKHYSRDFTNKLLNQFNQFALQQNTPLC